MSQSFLEDVKENPTTYEELYPELSPIFTCTNLVSVMRVFSGEKSGAIVPIIRYDDDSIESRGMVELQYEGAVEKFKNLCTEYDIVCEFESESFRDTMVLIGQSESIISKLDSGDDREIGQVLGYPQEAVEWFADVGGGGKRSKFIHYYYLYRTLYENEEPVSSADVMNAYVKYYPSSSKAGLERSFEEAKAMYEALSRLDEICEPTQVLFHESHQLVHTNVGSSFWGVFWKLYFTGKQHIRRRDDVSLRERVSKELVGMYLTLSYRLFN